MGGRFDLKDCKGTNITILYTSHDIELLLEYGDFGFWRHNINIEDNQSLIRATKIIINKSKHMLVDKEVSTVLIMRALKSHIK